MRQRSISAIGVAIVGIVPAVMGGPVWATAFAVLCLIGFNEYLSMARKISPGVPPVGYLIVPLFASTASIDSSDSAVLGLAALAIGLPIIVILFRNDLTAAFNDWALAATGALYLGLPVAAAVTLRQLDGGVTAEWLDDLAETAALGWDAHPRGLAWLITIILVTWMADTFAYLGGRQFGKHPLSPVVSPKKTVEGLVAAIVAGALTGIAAIELFGLDVHWSAGILVGLTLTIVGLLGDLSESVMKRQAGIKDSGTIIPGHGGMLDRLDAILFNVVAGLYLAMLIDRYF